MSLTISTVRDELKTRLATITGLRAHDTFPDQINPPAAVVLPSSMDFDAAMARGVDVATFRVIVVISRASERSGQDKLDGYLGSSGSTSIKTAIEGDRDLNGAVHDLRVTRWEYQTVTYAGTEYLGAEFTVVVQG